MSISHLSLGHSQNQNSNQGPNRGPSRHAQAGIVFHSAMPNNQPPATPPYAHVQLNKDNLHSNNLHSNNLPSNSPYYGSATAQALGIPGFKPQTVAGIGNLEQLTTNTMPQTSKKIITTNPQQLTMNQPQQKIGVNMRQNNVAQQPKHKMTPLKVNNAPPQHQDEGNMSPKSQCGSDDEGEEVNKK